MKNKVKLYVNPEKKEALDVARVIKENCDRLKIELSDENTDYILGIGGDGTLIRLLSENNYSLKTKYIGANCGTLGFLQDFKIDKVLTVVKNPEVFKEEKIRFLSIEIISGKSKSKFYCMNEFELFNSNNKSFTTNVNINGEFLETFVGKGLLISTPTGSSAYNASAGGAILYPGIEAIQITPNAPIIHSKVRTLNKSLCLPSSYMLQLENTLNQEITIFSDGIKIFSGVYDTIKIKYSKKYLIKIVGPNSSYTKKLKEKLI